MNKQNNIVSLLEPVRTTLGNRIKIYGHQRKICNYFKEFLFPFLDKFRNWKTV
jgi:hypothetical protein